MSLFHQVLVLIFDLLITRFFISFSFQLNLWFSIQ